jgi:hypothetical protein
MLLILLADKVKPIVKVGTEATGLLLGMNRYPGCLGTGEAVFLGASKAVGDWFADRVAIRIHHRRCDGPALDNVTVDPVPVPPSALLMGSGLLGLVGLGWRRRKES